MTKPLDELRPTLDETGLPWRAEQGTKHVKIFLRERFVGIVPTNGTSSRRCERGMKNVRAQIRRAAREMT